MVRLFDRPLGQNLLALVCAAILVFAGVLERAKRPADDLPRSAPQPERRPRASGPARDAAAEAAHRAAAPPEFKPYEPEPGEQLHLGGERASAARRRLSSARAGSRIRVTPTTAAVICAAAATSIASAEPSPVATGPASAAPIANEPTFRPAAVVNTCP